MIFFPPHSVTCFIPHSRQILFWWLSYIREYCNGSSCELWYDFPISSQTFLDKWSNCQIRAVGTDLTLNKTVVVPSILRVITIIFDRLRILSIVSFRKKVEWKLRPNIDNQNRNLLQERKNFETELVSLDYRPSPYWQEKIWRQLPDPRPPQLLHSIEFSIIFFIKILKMGKKFMGGLHLFGLVDLSGKTQVSSAKFPKYFFHSAILLIGTQLSQSPVIKVHFAIMKFGINFSF